MAVGEMADDDCSLRNGAQELHVLAVDDSLVDRKVIERLLKISCCKVTAVESGKRALQYLGLDGEKSSVGFDDLKVNLIITDYSMPGMTGYELLKKIKESSALKEIPVVIMSSENILPRIDRCLEEGAEEFLVKPVKLSDVKRLKDFILRGEVKRNRKRKLLDDDPSSSSSAESLSLSPSSLACESSSSPGSLSIPQSLAYGSSSLPLACEPSSSPRSLSVPQSLACESLSSPRSLSMPQSLAFGSSSSLLDCESSSLPRSSSIPQSLAYVSSSLPLACESSSLPRSLSMPQSLAYGSSSTPLACESSPSPRSLPIQQSLAYGSSSSPGSMSSPQLLLKHPRLNNPS